MWAKENESCVYLIAIDGAFCNSPKRIHESFVMSSTVICASNKWHKPWEVFNINILDSLSLSIHFCVCRALSFSCVRASLFISSLFFSRSPSLFFLIYLPFFLAPFLSLSTRTTRSTRSTHSFGTCVFVKLNWNWFLLNVYYSSFCLFVCPYLVGQRINFNVAAIKFCT